MSKEEINIEFFSSPVMFSKLLAVVTNDGMRTIDNHLELVDHCIPYQFDFALLGFPQQSKARFSLRKRYDGLAMSFAEDSIHLPITDTFSLVYNLKSLINAHPIR